MHLKSQYLHRVNYVKYSYVYIVNDSVIYLCSVFADFIRQRLKNTFVSGFLSWHYL